jgi:NADH-quinone oxidoreductase subunit J
MLNEISFLLCGSLILAGAVGAMMLRNLVHCTLCAAGAFAGLAAIYLQLNAEFAGFAQLLVYVGAVAILIVFTILLTRSTELHPGAVYHSSSWWMGLLVGGLVLACLVGSIMYSPSLVRLPSQTASAPVKRIGDQLMSQYVMPLETIGLLLTAALLGAVVIAVREPEKSDPPAR